MVAPEVQGIDLFKIANRSICRDTLQIIDGAGPSVEVARPDGEMPARANATEPQRETGQENGQQNTTKTAETVDAHVQTSKTPKCTFAGVISIDLKRFADSSVALVECPDCSRTRSLSPGKGVLRFPPHDRRKIQTPVTSKRWSTSGKTDWDVVGS
jgi:hypothetical protein